MVGDPSFFRPRATQNAIIGVGKIALGGFGERVSAREMGSGNPQELGGKIAELRENRATHEIAAEPLTYELQA